MKQLLILLTSLLSISSILAQAPEKMSYQAVVRDGSNSLLANTAIGMRVSILKDSVNGNSVYTETHTTTTNPNGLVSIEIGGGSVVSGSFPGINWGNGTYFVRTETDPNGGTAYSITGVSQLLSVPYALHAKTAESTLDCGDKVELVRLYWQGSSVSTSWISGMARVKFNKDYFVNVDSITFLPYLRVADSTNSVFAELMDLTNNVPIANSLLQSNQTASFQDIGYSESGDLYPYLPSGEFTLGVRMRAGTAGMFSSVDHTFIVIYRH